MPGRLLIKCQFARCRLALAIAVVGVAAFTLTPAASSRPYRATVTKAPTAVARPNAIKQGPPRPKPDSKSPSTPSNLTLTASTATSVSLSWSASRDNVGVTGYEVFVNGTKRLVLQSLTATVDNLPCAASLTLGIDAYDAAGNRSRIVSISGSTAACVDTQPPTAPTALTQSSASSSSVTLAWAASTDDVGVAGYALFLDAIQIGLTSQRQYAFPGLTCGTTYAVAVAAFDTAGNYSPQTHAWAATAACPDSQPPTAPTSLAATSTSPTSISITWSSSTDNVAVAGYDVQVNGTLVGTTAGTDFVAGGLSCGSSYKFAVAAFDAVGNRSSAATVTAATAPCADAAPPTQPVLAQPSVTQTSITLAWTASQDNVGVVAYDIYRGSVLVASTSLTTYTIGGLSCGQTYTVSVDARDAASNTSAKSTLGVATSACTGGTDTQPPTAPTALAQLSPTVSSFTLGWRASTDNVGVAGYGVYLNGSRIAQPTSTSYGFSGLTCGTSYNVAVDAVDAAGNRSAATSTSMSTAPCLDTQAPTAPTNLNTNPSANGVALTWSPSTDNFAVAGYGVYVNGTAVGQAPAPAYTVSGLQCGTSYTLGVDAYDAAGNRSGKTAALVATTACPDTQAPSAPGSVQTTQATPTGMTVSWSASTDNVGVTGYGVYINGTAAGSTANTSYSLSGLTCGTSYTVAVDAVDGAGNHSSKSTATGQTSACAPAGGGGLTWAPPTLVNPTTIQVSSPTTDLNLDPSRDYVLKLPSTPLIPGGDGGIYINGGHNVVVIGGELYFDKTSGATEGNGRVAAIFNNTGTVHFEGLWAHGPGIVEGIQNYSSQTIVQVEDCRFDRLDGKGVYHSDLFQFGVGKELRIDHFTGSSNVQGLFVTDMSGHVYANNVNINGDSGADILTWQGSTYVPWTIQAFYLHVSDGSSLGVHVWPSIYGTAPYQAQVTPDGSVSWPSPVNIGGSILNGTPPGGDFVPTGVAGLGYVSPGYAG